MFWHTKWGLCALAYFDPKKYTWKPKLTVFSLLNQRFSADDITFISKDIFEFLYYLLGIYKFGCAGELCEDSQN